MTARYQTSRPDQWTCPRPTPDPRKYGAIMPMEQPRLGLLRRVFGIWRT